jgi:hypothetical protein
MELNYRVYAREMAERLKWNSTILSDVFGRSIFKAGPEMIEALSL